MPIKFVTLNQTFIDILARRAPQYEALNMKIEDYIPTAGRKTYYVSPANSLCFMDGGIDLALSRAVFPGIEPVVKRAVAGIGITNLLGRFYLPIGSSIIFDCASAGAAARDRALVVAPTMLLPQNVARTRNAYYATMATLYNVLVNSGQNIADIDILFTSFCCGYGKMDEEESVAQILAGIDDYAGYQPRATKKNIVIHEPNLLEQLKYYQNTEFFDIPAAEIVRC